MAIEGCGAILQSQPVHFYGVLASAGSMDVVYYAATSLLSVEFVTLSEMCVSVNSQHGGTLYCPCVIQQTLHFPLILNDG